MSNITLPKPHSPGQKELIYSTTNDVVFAGRRYGKTHTGKCRIIKNALSNVGLYWWVGLGWKSASLKRAWRELKEFTTQAWDYLGEDSTKYIRESVKELTLPGGSNVWMRTAERPDSLAGEGIKGVVLDEFSLMQEKVWSEYVEATLLDHSGWALFIGVPKGNNWASDLWHESSGREGWRQFHFTTADNPQMKPADIEQIRLHNPKKLFDQEYLAKVLSDAGEVFVNITACAISTPVTVPVKNHVYVAGIDWGKQNDFTVLSVFDTEERRQVAQFRFNGSSYPTQLGQIKQVHNLFRFRVIVAEQNTLGIPLCDQLQADGLPIRRFNTTNSTKRKLIETLQVGFENSSIKILNDPDLIAELRSFESNVTSFGNVRYGAPSGKHDDCVMALALGWQETVKGLGVTI